MFPEIQQKTVARTLVRRTNGVLIDTSCIHLYTVFTLIRLDPKFSRVLREEYRGRRPGDPDFMVTSTTPVSMVLMDPRSG